MMEPGSASQEHVNARRLKRPAMLVAAVGVAAILTMIGANHFREEKVGVLQAVSAKPPADAPAPGANEQAAGTLPRSDIGTQPAPAAAEPAVAAGAYGTSTRDVLQRRLDALAQAYEEGSVPAAERAMWPNHAVKRLDGQTLNRSELLGQWVTEWEQLKNRKLTLFVDHVEEEGPRVTAVWLIHLTADLVDPQGETHRMEMTGSQRATFLRAGDDESLEEPIEYKGYERTLDGYPWPLDQQPS